MLAKNAAAAGAIRLDRVRPGVQPDHGDEHDQADVHQQPLRRLGNRAEHRVAAARPAGDEADDENRSGRAESERRSPPTLSLSRPSSMPTQMPPARNVRSVLARSRSTNPTCVAGALDVVGRADDAEDVAALIVVHGSRGSSTVPRCSDSR